MIKKPLNKKHGKKKLESTLGDFEVFDYHAMEKEAGRESQNYRSRKYMMVADDGSISRCDEIEGLEEYVESLEIEKAESKSK